MNSNNLKDLYESYSAVYDDNLRKSLKFETWVNELLDEGYDLSDYTLDELYDVYEGYKERPVSRMNKQARRIAFSHGTDVNSDEGSSGNVPHSNAARALAKMARFGGKQVKSHIKKGYEQGSKYDPYYQELNSRNPSRNKEFFETWVNELLDEGYDLSDYTLDELYDVYEGYKERPVSRMNKQARRIAFSHGTDVNSDEGSSGNVPHSNAARALAKMARFGGKQVKSHIKKGYEQGSKYDPYYQELNSRNPSRNKEF